MYSSSANQNQSRGLDEINVRPSETDEEISRSSAVAGGEIVLSESSSTQNERVEALVATSTAISSEMPVPSIVSSVVEDQSSGALVSSIDSSIEGTIVCPICYGDEANISALKCGHVFGTT